MRSRRVWYCEPGVTVLRPAALFFLSGAAALMYQVLWLRQLSLVFGVTVYAAGAVLAAFMAGLAIGSLLAGRVLARGVNPLAAFGAAEALIGVVGALSPSLLDAASWAYGALHRYAPDSVGTLTIARLVCSMAILIVPTGLMGLTLPLLTAATAGRETVGSRVGVLYAFNTGGAVVGSLATGFWVIPALGMARGFLLAAALNLLVGATALWWARRTPAAAGPAVVSRPADDGLRAGALTSPELWRLRLVMALSGFAALGLEVVWFRVLLQLVEATAQAFTVMLAVVLAGIAAGSTIASRLLRRDRHWATWLAGLQLATAVTVVGSTWLLVHLVRDGWSLDRLRTVTLTILPAAVLMGVAFPVALAVGVGRRAASAEAGGRVGDLYAANVLAAIAGSLAAGFLLLPALGSQGTLVSLAAVYLASAVVVPQAWPRRRWAGALALAGSAVWFAGIVRATPDPIRTLLARRHGNELLEIWRDEGPQTVVSVFGSQFRRVLYLNGLHQANDLPEMVLVHRVIGHLPMVLHGDPREVLVIGLGGGATAGAISRHPQARVDIVELADGVRRAAAHFAHVNYDVLNQPAVRLRIDDGRNFLLLTPRRFDVITADIIQPGHAGAGLLYSREYFSLVRRALAPNGIALQWIGHRAPAEYTLIMRTFLDVFPHATLWYDATLLVGAHQPLRLDAKAIERLRREPQTREALDAVGLASFEVLCQWYTAGPEQMRAFVGPGPVLTDDRPLVEYRWLPRDQGPLDLTPLRNDGGPPVAPCPPRR